jgi:hypothetical protein
MSLLLLLMLMPFWFRRRHEEDARHCLLLLLILMSTTTILFPSIIMVDGFAVGDNLPSSSSSPRGVDLFGRMMNHGQRRRSQCFCHDCHGDYYHHHCQICMNANMMVPTMTSSQADSCHHDDDYRNNQQQQPLIIQIPKQQRDLHYFNNDAAGGGGGRRLFLSRIAATLWFPLVPVLTTASPSPSYAALPLSIFSPSLSSETRRRQLELCLVTVLRTKYWAMSVARGMNTQLLLLLPPPSSSSSIAISTNTKTGDDDNPQKQQSPPSSELLLTESQKKSSYLEARLGAKALLTQKIGGGANARVITLGGFQLKECLDDVKYWCREYYYAQKKYPLLDNNSSSNNNNTGNKKICSIDLSNAIDDLIDSLASIVEFDGLETTIDPSPRSSLMLSMYNHQKGTFVYRTLMERVIPSCERILNVFGRDRRRIVEEFVRSNYNHAMETTTTTTTTTTFPL